jgi:hypothetical protein
MAFAIRGVFYMLIYFIGDKKLRKSNFMILNSALMRPSQFMTRLALLKRLTAALSLQR